MPPGAGRRGSRRHGSATTTAPAGRPGSGERGEQGPALRAVLPGVSRPGSPRRRTRRSPASRRRRRPRGTGRAAGTGLPGCHRCRRRGRSARRTRPAPPGASCPGPAAPGPLAARVAESPAIRPAWCGRPRGFFPVIACPSRAPAHLAGGRAGRCAGREQAGTQRAGSTVVPGLGGGLQVRPLSGRSLACAVSRARSSRARTARAAPGVSCGSAGVKVTSISSAPAGSCGGRGLPGAGGPRRLRGHAAPRSPGTVPGAAPPRRRRNRAAGGMPRQVRGRRGRT